LRLLIIAHGEFAQNFSKNNIKDILDPIKKLDPDEVSTLIHVIKCPTTVTIMPVVAYTGLSTKLNRVERLFMVVATKLDGYELNYPQLPKPAIPDSHAAIIFSNLPPTLFYPIKCKVVIHQIDGHRSITSIRHVRDKLIINIDKSAAKDFRSLITGSSAKVHTKTFFGVLKGIASNFELTHLKSCPGVLAAQKTRIIDEH